MCTNGMAMDEVADSDADGTKLSPKPVVHPPTDGPLCAECRKLDKTFFDLKCSDCESLLYDEATTVSELFAILRQWIPQTQQNILLIIEQVRMITLRLGNDCLWSTSATTHTVLWQWARTDKYVTQNIGFTGGGQADDVPRPLCHESFSTYTSMPPNKFDRFSVYTMKIKCSLMQHIH